MSCEHPPTKLLPLDEAAAVVVDTATRLRDARHETRVVSLWEASGMVLAEDVRADRDQPPFDKAMMDGYAVRTADLEAGQLTLAVVGEVAAGTVPTRTVGPGEAISVMTGAPVPDGADAIQMVELTDRDGDRVTLRAPVAPRTHIQRAGAHARAGDVVVARGRVVEALTAGVLGSVGAAQLTVVRPPRVTVIATGDELVGLEDSPGPGQIRDSNRRSLMALLEGESCRVVDGGIIPDDRTLLRKALVDGRASDVIVFSGGVSAGVYDLLRECFEAEGGEVLFHQIAIKPGKPALFGRMGQTLVFGLPGNPVSAFVTAVFLLLPAVRVLGHRPEHRPFVLSAPLEGELPAAEKRTTIHPGELALAASGDGLVVRPVRWDGSADLFGYAKGNVLIRCEPRAPAARSGDLVRVVLPRGVATW